MQKILGDAVGQEFIRKANPNKSHCKFLQECPVACETLHKDIGKDGKKGNKCPNNPLVRHKEIFERFEEEQDIVMEALHWEGLISLGMMPTSLDEINPIEYQIALCVKQFMDSRELIAKSLSNMGLDSGSGRSDGNN